MSIRNSQQKEARLNKCRSKNQNVELSGPDLFKVWISPLDVLRLHVRVLTWTCKVRRSSPRTALLRFGSRRLKRQLKQERRSFAGAIALDGQGSAHLFRGERAAVQTEAVSFFAGGETVIEDAAQILGKNSDT